MKNEHIKSLKEVVPAEIRLEVYKEALSLIKSGKTVSGMGSHGLCLLFPCLLWSLEDTSDLAPNGQSWLFWDSTRAFPELTEEIIQNLENSGDTILRNKKRINYLIKFIEELS